MLVLTVLVNIAVFAPVIRDTPLRVPLGLAFVLFVPGYVFIAALFPEAGEPPGDAELEGGDDETQETAGFVPIPTGYGDRGIDGIERVALAFGLSIAIVPLIGLALNFTPWGIRLTPIMVAVSGFVGGATIVAAVRRWQLPEQDRFTVPYREWWHRGKTEVFEPETRLDGALNVLLALSIILAVGTVSFAVLFPPSGEQFSELYLLTEDEDGERVAANYPTEFVEGESQEVIVGVGNNEHRDVEYTVVVLEQTTDGDGNETTVTDQRELDRFDVTLEHNETSHVPYEIQPTFVEDDVRIQWLLFLDGDIPDEPTADDTDYDVHLWVDVEPAE